MTAASCSFYNRVSIDKVIAAYERNNYKLFVNGDYNLNLFGIRSSDMTSNTFNDLIGVLYQKNNNWVLYKYGATTDPGLYYRENPMSIDGTAILAPGQYSGAFKIGYHKGKYKALVQNKPLLLYRDANRNNVLEYIGEPSWQMAGINIHRANANVTSKLVDCYSAGCCVVANPDDFAELLTVCEKSKSIYGDGFTFTLFTEEDFFG